MARILTRAASKAGRLLSRFQGRRFTNALAEAALGFTRRIGNEDFDARRNGEERVVRALSELQPRLVFDVGANAGTWSRGVAELYPGCEVHAFEIVPSTAEALRRALAAVPRVRVNDFGLSDASGEIPIHLPEAAAPTMATAFPVPSGVADGTRYTRLVQCRTRRAEEYLLEQELGRIDFVKIDVEGMDLKVIRGFGAALQSVRALQFEYGVFNIASHDLLFDFCRYLNERGFTVGKIYPRWVEFFEYGFARENFFGSNYVAVRTEEAAFLRRLATYGP